jgi:hypothetical protein
MSNLSYLPKRAAFPSELRTLFEQLAAWAVASSFGAAAAGCGTSQPVERDTVKHAAPVQTPPTPPAAPWEAPPTCTEGSLELGALRLDKPVDYVAAVRSGPMLDRAMNYRFASAKQGTPCASATDKAKCEAEVKSLMTPPDECGCEPSLLVTQGDSVRSITTSTEYLGLSGAIDTSAEALLAAFLAGQRVACGDQPDEGTKLRASGTGYEVFAKWEDCGRGVFDQTTFVAADGTTRVGQANKLDESHCVVGRRPEGLCFAAPLAAHTALGEYFACAARLEAASVFAFERLGRELRALSAPDELVRRCTQSAVEEIAHTRITSALARRFYAEPALPALVELPVRGMVEIAVENAVEGCVRETFGALVAYHQAATSGDPSVRAAMMVIAEDEARHADLAWTISRWLEPQLSPAEQACVAVARSAAMHKLEDSVDLELGDSERIAIGWPSREAQESWRARLRLALA